MSEMKHARTYTIIDAKYEFSISEDVSYTFKQMNDAGIDTIGDCFLKGTFIPKEFGNWLNKYGVEVVMEAYQDWLVARRNHEDR